MNTLRYKGDTAAIEFDGRDNLLVGHIADIDAIISFHAASVSDLQQAFEDAVDDDLDVCAKRNQTPRAQPEPTGGRGAR